MKPRYEVAFGRGPADTLAPADWVDVTEHVRDFEGVIEPLHVTREDVGGVADFNLDNRDGQFDPEHSPYDIAPLTPVRVTADVDGQSFPLFYGFVEDWGLDYPTDAFNDASIRVSCVDAMTVLNQHDLGRSIVAELLEDRPVGYWPGHDTHRNRVFDYSDSGIELVGAARPNSSLYAGGGRPSLYVGAGLTAASQQVLRIRGDLTVRATVNLSQGRVVVAQLRLSADDEAYRVVYSADGTLSFRQARDGVETLVETPVVVSAGQTHVVEVVRDGQRVRFRVDGVEVYEGRLFGPAGGGAGTLTVAQGLDDAQGRIQDVAIYNRALPVSRHRRIWQSRLDSFPSEYAGPRVQKVLDFIDVAGTVDKGSDPLAPVDVEGSALSFLRDVAASDDGRLYVQADGTVRFEGRAARLNPRGRLVVWDGQVAVWDGEKVRWGIPEFSRDGLPFVDVGFVYEESGVATEVTVETADGPVTVTGSTERFGVRDLTVRAPHATATSGESRGRWELRELDGKVRCDRLTIMPQGRPELWWVALGLELGDAVRVVANLPGGIVRDLTMRVDRITHRLGRKVWVTECELSPAVEGSWWQIGDPEFGQIDSVNVLAY